MRSAFFGWLVLVAANLAEANELDLQGLTEAFSKRDCTTVVDGGMALAEAGNARAQLFVGRCMLQYGDDARAEQAVVWLDKALRNGEPVASRYLAIYYYGLYSATKDSRSLEMTCRYSEMGASLGDEVARGYLQGFGCSNAAHASKSSPAPVVEAVIEADAGAERAKEEQLEILFTYLGKPIVFSSVVSAFCRDDSSGAIAPCHFRKDPDGRYWIDLLPPGRYVLRVEVDENLANPAEGPGDFWRYFQFKVNEQGNGPLRVSMQKLIHMIGPEDNNGVLAANSAPCEQKPHYEVPLLTLLPEAAVKFAWEPLEPEVIYHYTLWTAKCGGGGMARLLYKQTPEMEVTEPLPPNEADEFYLFRITAVKDGEMIGDFMLRDNGGSGMRQYQFRVVDPLAPRDYLYYAAAGVLLLLLVVLLIRRHSARHDVESRHDSRSEVWRTMLLLVLLPSLAAAGYYGYNHYQKRLAEQALRDAEIKARARMEERQSHRRAEFELSVPLPYWWSSMPEPKYLFNSHGDIVQVLGRIDHSMGGLGSRREIVKRCYLSIIAHAADDDLVNQCLSLITTLEDEKEVALKAAEFGIAHYFNHKHTTDYCQGCMPADETASHVTQAARLYSYYDQPQKAVDLITRFLQAREAETAPFMLSGMYSALSHAYWMRGEKERAIGVLERGTDRLGKSSDIRNLQRDLERYRRMVSGADPGPEAEQ